MEAEDRRAEHALEHLLAPRADAERLGVGPGDVPEGDDGGARQALAHHARQQREVVVLHQHDRVVGARLVRHHVGEAPVHRLVVLPVGRAEDRPRVRDVAERPQALVGEAVVVALLLLLRQPDAADAVRRASPAAPSRGRACRPCRGRPSRRRARSRCRSRRASPARARSPGRSPGAGSRSRCPCAARGCRARGWRRSAPRRPSGPGAGCGAARPGPQVVWLSSRARRSLSRSRTSACRSRAIGRSSGAARRRRLGRRRAQQRLAREHRLDAGDPAAPADLGDHHGDQRDHRGDRRRTATARTCACPRCAAARSSCRARSSARRASRRRRRSGCAETCSGPSASSQHAVARLAPLARRAAHRRPGKPAWRRASLPARSQKPSAKTRSPCSDAVEIAQHALARAARARAAARPAAPAPSARSARRACRGRARTTGRSAGRRAAPPRRRWRRARGRAVRRSAAKAASDLQSPVDPLRPSANFTPRPGALCVVVRLHLDGARRLLDRLEDLDIAAEGVAPSSLNRRALTSTRDSSEPTAL